MTFEFMRNNYGASEYLGGKGAKSVVAFLLSLACLLISVFIVLASARIVSAQKEMERN